MIHFYFEPDAPEKLSGYFERVKQQILRAVRVGMHQAMEELAVYIATHKLSGGFTTSGVLQRRSGRLAEAVLESARVKLVEDQAVFGSVNAVPHDNPGEGYWQEFGTVHPAIAGKLRVFATPDGEMVFTQRTAEFKIDPNPFMNPALRERQSAIMETIRRHLREAVLE